MALKAPCFPPLPNSPILQPTHNYSSQHSKVPCSHLGSICRECILPQHTCKYTTFLFHHSSSRLKVLHIFSWVLSCFVSVVVCLFELWHFKTCSWYRVSQSSGWSWAHYVAKNDDVQLLIFLPLFSKCSDHRPVPPRPDELWELFMF